MSDREKAWNLLCKYTETDSLRKHALAVESAMRHFAGRFGEDADYWGAVGLLHDFDYEKYPDVINSVLSHVDTTGIPRDNRLKKTLFAVDELCGFVTAVALVRPSKKVADVEVKSVLKKMKDKAFARQVSRDDIKKGAEELGLPLDEVVENVIEALKVSAAELGL